jgi:preprotein translocase subunit SecF
MQWWIWLIIAIVVVAIIAAIVMAGNKKKKERDRSRAGELREEAAVKATDVQQHDARARETEARAAEARAESERKQAEADRLAAQAQDRTRTADEHREEHQEHLRRADELDPDVDHKSDEYAGPGVGDGAAGQDGTEPTTVTHADGTTEAVSDPQGDGGTHRA